MRTHGQFFWHQTFLFSGNLAPGVAEKSFCFRGFRPRFWSKICFSLHVWRQPNPFKKTTFLQGFGTFLADFCYFPTGPTVVPKTRKLVPDCIPTKSRLDPDWSKVAPKNAKLVPTTSRLDHWFSSKKHLFPKIWGPISEIVAPCRAPPPPPDPPPNSLKPNTGNSIYSGQSQL